MDNLKRLDPKLAALIASEIKRQQSTLDLIPSENIAPLAMLEAVGSPLMNKYSEGYPGKRYYPGNEYYDEIERMAQERALVAFGLDPNEWHVNVQAYSGSPANAAIYSALMELGDTLMGMQLASGGHLTHGHKVSFTGRAWRPVQYGVNAETGLIDYEAMARLAQIEKPKVIVSGATAYPREIDFEKFGSVAKEIGAYHVADISHIAGLVLAGLHKNPFPYADVVMTTTHKTLRGPRGAVIFCRRELAEKIDKAVFPGLQGGPHDNITAAKALMFELAMKPEFEQYEVEIVKNAKTLAVELVRLGFKLVSGGTDTHLMLIDLKNKGIDGTEAEKRLEAAAIIANRNSVPGDQSPFRPSGIRLGTPAVTSRGLKEKEMKLIASWINRLLTENEPAAKIKEEVEALCRRYPLEY